MRSWCGQTPPDMVSYRTTIGFFGVRVRFLREEQAGFHQPRSKRDLAWNSSDRTKRASVRAPSASDRAKRASVRAPSASDRAKRASVRAPSASDRAKRASVRAPSASDRAKRASVRAPSASDRAKRASVRAPSATDDIPGVNIMMCTRKRGNGPVDANSDTVGEFVGARLARARCRATASRHASQHAAHLPHCVKQCGSTRVAPTRWAIRQQYQILDAHSFL